MRAKPFRSFRSANRSGWEGFRAIAARSRRWHRILRRRTGKRTVRTIMLAVVLAGQSGGVDAPPLTPVRPWNIEYADSMCVAARAYGEVSAPVTIGFKPTPFGDTLQTVVLGTRKQLGRQARVDVVLEAPGREFGEKLEGTRVHFPTGDKAVLTFYLSRDQLETLVGAPTFTIRASGAPPISVALAMGNPVLAGLKTCETDLMIHFGYDPAKIAAVVKRAEAADNQIWLSADDYPASALNARKEGMTLIGWTISTNGRVTDCRVLKSSGTSELDQAACTGILRRGRYRPALDAAGSPVESYSTRLVRWTLPG